MTDTMQGVLSDSYLRNYVGYYAHKVARRFPNSMDKEDVEQDLWEAIIRAMKRYDGTVSPSEHARLAVFSKYGSMINKRLKKLPFNEKMFRYDQTPTHLSNHYTEDHISYFTGEDPIFSSTDLSYLLIEERDVLERIGKELRAKAEEGRSYILTYQWFQAMQEGLTVSESAARLGVSENYLYQIKHRALGIVRSLGITP